MEITIEKIGYDLVLAVVSAILGALFGVLIPNLLKDEKKTTDRPVIKDSNSVYVDRPVNMQISDSVMIYRDQTASVL